MSKSSIRVWAHCELFTSIKRASGWPFTTSSIPNVTKTYPASICSVIVLSRFLSTDLFTHHRLHKFTLGSWWSAIRFSLKHDFDPFKSSFESAPKTVIANRSWNDCLKRVTLSTPTKGDFEANNLDPLPKYITSQESTSIQELSVNEPGGSYKLFVCDWLWSRWQVHSISLGDKSCIGLGGQSTKKTVPEFSPKQLPGFKWYFALKMLDVSFMVF